MREPYSHLIWQVREASSTVYATLDPGYTYVVRCMDAFFPGPNILAGLSVGDQVDGGTFWTITEEEIGAFGSWAQWTGRQVFTAPGVVPWQAIFAQPNGTSFDLRVSGFRLLNP